MEGIVLCTDYKRWFVVLGEKRYVVEVVGEGIDIESVFVDQRVRVKWENVVNKRDFKKWGQFVMVEWEGVEFCEERKCLLKES